jgi:peptide/nickel transport system substrate-binding protein
VKTARFRAFSSGKALVGIAAMLSLGLAACSSSGHPGSSPSSNATGAAATAAGPPSTPAGSLTAADPESPSSLDPADGTSGYDYEYLYPIYATLLTFNPTTLAPEPGIATKWKFEGANNLTFALTLKPGLKFQDGTPLNAAAVKTSMEHDIKLGVDTELTGAVKNILVTGTDSLEIQLTHPMSDLPAILADRPGMIVSPTALAKYGSSFGNHPVGAGPYELASYVPGSKVVLKAWPGYQSAGQPAPRLQQLTILTVGDPTALANELTSGQVQYAFDVSPTNLSVLSADSNLVVKQEHSLAMSMIVPNISIKPLNNVDVRLAMEYAINRTALDATAQAAGVGAPAWTPTPVGNPVFDPASQNAWPYNPAKAKQLLKAAGYPNGITISGTTINIPPFDTDSTVLASMWGKVGIHVNWATDTGAQALENFNVKHTASLFSTAWSGRPSQVLTYLQLYQSTSEYRPGGVLGIPGLDAALNTLTTSYSAASLQKAIAAVNTIADKYAILFPLYTQPNITVYASNVLGDTPNAQGKNNLNYIYLAK